MRVYALVPAAGRGERFGGPKLLTKWKDRELLGHVLLTLGEARTAGILAGTIVVHRADDAAVVALAADYRAYPVATRDPGGELSDSIRTGIEAIRREDSGQESSALLICLGDQPLLRVEVIRSLIQAWQSGSAVVRPNYRDTAGEPGHPMLIDRTLWHLAAEMRGETGFAPVLARRAITIRTIVVGGHNPDIDTPEDLNLLEAPAAPPRTD